MRALDEIRDRDHIADALAAIAAQIALQQGLLPRGAAVATEVSVMIVPARPSHDALNDGRIRGLHRAYTSADNRFRGYAYAGARHAATASVTWPITAP